MFSRILCTFLFLLLVSSGCLAAPAGAPGNETPALPLRGPELEKLLMLVKAPDRDASRRALKTILERGDDSAYRGLYKIVVESDDPGLRRLVLAGLGKSGKDLGGLYLMDCHKDLREEFSQSDAGLELARVYSGFAQSIDDWALKNTKKQYSRFTEVLKAHLSGARGDLSLLCLSLLRSYPYTQIVDYLKDLANDGGLFEQVGAAYVLASLPGGVGVPVLEQLYKLDNFPASARLISYAVLLKGYCSSPGASALVLKRLKTEREYPLRMFLVKGAGKYAGREAIDVLNGLQDMQGALPAVRDAAVNAIKTRIPSEYTYFFAIVTVGGIFLLFLFAISFLRMPPAVIDNYYLSGTSFCDIDVQMEECDMAQLIQSAVVIDPSCFGRFIRVSLLYEGTGEIGFRRNSILLLDDAPYNFVGGGTIVDDWFWNRGGTGRVVANWYFDFKRYEGLQGKPPLMLGFLYRAVKEDAGADDRVIKLKIAGLKPGCLSSQAAVPDKSMARFQAKMMS